MGDFNSLLKRKRWKSQTFNANGTWTNPGVDTVFVSACGEKTSSASIIDGGDTTVSGASGTIKAFGGVCNSHEISAGSFSIEPFVPPTSIHNVALDVSGNTNATITIPNLTLVAANKGWVTMSWEEEYV